MHFQDAVYIEIIRFIITGLFIVAGWIVVHKLSIKREQDKARKEMAITSADTLCELIEGINELATQYHSNERNTNSEAKIKMLLQDLNIRVTALNKIVEEDLCKPIWDEVINYRRAITGSHFEDEHLAATKPPSNQLDLITETTLSIKRKLINLKHSQFSIVNTKL